MTYSRKFYKAYPGQTDYGACCLIVPYLNLINETTRALDPENFDNNWYHNIPPGENTQS